MHSDTMPYPGLVTTTLAARTGDASPGMPEGATWVTLPDAANVRSGPFIIFEGASTGGGVTSADNEGIWHGAPGSLSLLARVLVRREARVLRHLRGWRHAPALLGTLGGLALGIEFVPGVALGEVATQTGDAVFQQLRGAVASLHAAGITHNDLHPANVLVAGTTPVLIDFTSALRTPRWLRRIPLVRELRRSDLANVLKMQQRITGQPLSDKEAQLLRPPGWVDAIRTGWKRVYRRLKA